MESEARREQTGGQVFVVAGSKGGVGKSNFALNLGIQLARRRWRVILFDADFGLANVDILLDLAPLAEAADVLDPAQALDDVLVDGPAGLRVLCGTSGAAPWPERRFGAVECARAARRLARACDILLVDCGSAMNPGLVAFAQASAWFILLITPEPTALADGYATLKYLRQDGFTGRIGVVVNMARSRREAMEVAQRMARAARHFLGLAVSNLGHVPMDPHVPRAVRARVPVSVRWPHCAASLALQRICGRLCPAGRPRTAPAGVWSRLAGLFL